MPCTLLPFSLLFSPHLWLSLLYPSLSRELGTFTCQPSFTGIWCEIDLTENHAATVNLGGLQINFKVFLAKNIVCLKREGVISYCNLSCGCSLCCPHACSRGLLKGQDSFIWAEINIKWWPSSINPIVRTCNSSPERKAVVSRAGAGHRIAEGERCVSRGWLMDGEVITPQEERVIYCQLLVSRWLLFLLWQWLQSGCMDKQLPQRSPSAT